MLTCSVKDNCTALRCAVLYCTALHYTVPLHAPTNFMYCNSMMLTASSNWHFLCSSHMTNLWVASAVIVLKYIFQKSFKIIHEENTKKNHKHVVFLYVIEISLDLHKLYLWFSRLTQHIFWKLLRWWNIRSACFIRPKDTRLRLVSLYLIKHCMLLMF
jgi:hypothetical protein